MLFSVVVFWTSKANLPEHRLLAATVCLGLQQSRARLRTAITLCLTKDYIISRHDAKAIGYITVQNQYQV